MLERLIIFLILGAFVFMPEMTRIAGDNLSPWYAVYIPWFLLLVAVTHEHWRKPDRPT